MAKPPQKPKETSQDRLLGAFGRRAGGLRSLRGQDEEQLAALAASAGGPGLGGRLDATPETWNRVIWLWVKTNGILGRRTTHSSGGK